MYTLRVINEEITSNHIIGEGYQLVKKGQKHFDDYCKRAGLSPKSKEVCFGIIHSSGLGYWGLYEGNEYYVMTESGKTFERLTC